MRKVIKNINIVKKTFNLDILSGQERQGIILYKTYLKFIRKTSIRVPFVLGRSIRGLAFCGNINRDPFGAMVSNLGSGKTVDSLAEDLYFSYQKQRHLNISEFLGLEENCLLSEYPIWCLVLPWEDECLQDRYHSYSNAFWRNRSNHGLNKEQYLNSVGDLESGFYTFSAAKSQVIQTLSLFNLIKKNGYIETPSLPRVDILINSDEWRWIMSGNGNHRAYIASCLKYKFISSQINSIVRRSDVDKWENVKNGTYSRQEALGIFDKVFSGKSIMRGLV